MSFKPPIPAVGDEIFVEGVVYKVLIRRFTYAPTEILVYLQVEKELRYVMEL